MQGQLVAGQHVSQSHLRVDELVAELGKEQFWMLLPHLVEALAYFGIQANSDIVVDSIILLQMLPLSTDGHVPSV